MLRTSFRRSSRSRIIRALTILVFVVFTVDLVSLVLNRQHQSHSQAAAPNVHGQRLFIASIHWNNEQILRSNWNKAVIDLVKYFGPENVYVSVHESGSWDDSKGALRELDNHLKELRVNHTVSLDETTHLDEIQRDPASTGWIDTSRGRKELRRIPYLSRLRNVSLKPLAELGSQGIKFDKVLFLNDVVFTNDDVANLLATRDGEYAAACSLDFARPPSYYDTFALRDSAGHEALSSTWPYFRSKHSRNAMISGQPAPVQSCWNGIVAFDATPFYTSDPLGFRGVPDSLASHHLEGSECCLIHADNPFTSTRGVWVNPNVRVGYSPEAYNAVHPGGGSEAPQVSGPGTAVWPSTISSVSGIWKARLASWITTTTLKERAVRRKIAKWRKEDQETDRREVGGMCLINEMQVLVENGWAHV